MAKIYTIKWTETARNDLESIIDYIAIDSPQNALSVLDRLETKVKILEKFPKQGRIIPELEPYNYFMYREIIETPWRIIYKNDSDIIYIMAIIDGRRNVEDILVKRMINNIM